MATLTTIGLVSALLGVLLGATRSHRPDALTLNELWDAVQQAGPARVAALAVVVALTVAALVLADTARLSAHTARGACIALTAIAAHLASLAQPARLPSIGATAR